MVVIFSYNGDLATPSIMDWLIKFQCPYKRVNLEEEDFRKITIQLSNEKTCLSLELEDKTILDFENISWCLYRVCWAPNFRP